MPLSLSVSAETDDYNYYFDYYYNTSYHVQAEQFQYTCDGVKGLVETDVTDANWMITGVFEHDQYDADFYTVANLKTGERGNMYVKDISNWIDGKTLMIGDLLYIDEMHGVEVTPVEYYPAANDPSFTGSNEVRYVGYGVDVLGEAFTKVIRHELVTKGVSFMEYATQFAPKRLAEAEKRIMAAKERLENFVIPGDVNEDEKVSIMDVILINKAIYGKAQLCNYAVLASDINQNGAPDSADSLTVMKKAIGVE